MVNSKQKFKLTLEINKLDRARKLFEELRLIANDKTSSNSSIKIVMEMKDNMKDILWQETKFYNSLDKVNADYRLKNISLKTLPSNRDVREASARSSRAVGVFNDIKGILYYYLYN